MSIVYRSAPISGLEALYCLSDFSFTEHLHSGHVVWLNTGCGEHFRIKGTSAILQPGSLSIIEAGVIHANHPCAPGRRQLRSLYLEETFFADLARKFDLPGHRPPMMRSQVVTDPVLWQTMAALHAALMANEDGFALETAVMSVFHQLLTGCGAMQPLGRRSPGDNGLRLQRITTYLHEHLEEQVSLDLLAGIADCSVVHLIRLFRAQVGTTPHEYLTQIRLERARQLIIAGLSLADAAFKSGFADQSHLTRNFRQRYGLPPGAYRMQYKQC